MICASAKHPINNLWFDGQIWRLLTREISSLFETNNLFDLSTLSLALGPKLLQNWLDETENGEILHGFESNGLVLGKSEPLIYLTNTKTNKVHWITQYYFLLLVV